MDHAEETQVLWDSLDPAIQFVVADSFDADLQTTNEMVQSLSDLCGSCEQGFIGPDGRCDVCECDKDFEDINNVIGQ